MAGSATLKPGNRPRRLTAEEYHLYTPEKLELIRGEVPGAEKLLLLLLTNVGLHRAATLVGHETWRRAIEPSEPSTEDGKEAKG
jgi:hypothetical protein